MRRLGEVSCTCLKLDLQESLDRPPCFAQAACTRRLMLQADLHADKSTQHGTDRGVAAIETDDIDLRPSFLRVQHTGVSS